MKASAEQQAQALAQWKQIEQSPQYVALSGGDKTKAYMQFIHDNVDSSVTVPGGGFFQAVPGQPGWETTGSRIAGGVAGGLIAGGLLAGGAGAGGGGATAASQATEGVADGGVTAGGGTAAAGGTGASWLTKAGQLGSVVNGIEQGRAQARNQEAEQNLAYDKLNLTAPGQRASNAVRGDILANVQPVSISGPLTHTGGKMPVISGGLTPSLLSPNTRQLGQDMSRQALLSQMDNGGNYQPPQPNGVDTALQGAGYLGLGLGALGYLKPTPVTPPAAKNAYDPSMFPNYINGVG